MAYGLGEKLEHYLTKYFKSFGKPWGQKSRSSKYAKQAKNRRERKRIKLNPEAEPEHKRFRGYEW